LSVGFPIWLEHRSGELGCNCETEKTKTAPQNRAEGRRSRISFSPGGVCLLEKLIFAAIASGGLIALLLAVIGVKPVLFERDPYLGFSSRIPLFVREDWRCAPRRSFLMIRPCNLRPVL
jgi:hypothetical protein